MNEARPNKLTTEMALEIGRTIAKRLADNSLIEQKEIDGCAEDIAKHGRPHQDGYELAKRLDSMAYWNCDLQMAEELDAFYMLAASAIEAAEKEWAERNSVAPPLPIGARVTLRKTGETGEIDRIYEHGAAKYCIKIDGDDRAEPPRLRRRIVNFEDVAEIEAQAPHIDPAGTVSA